MLNKKNEKKFKKDYGKDVLEKIDNNYLKKGYNIIALPREFLLNDFCYEKFVLNLVKELDKVRVQDQIHKLGEVTFLLKDTNIKNNKKYKVVTIIITEEKSEIRSLFELNVNSEEVILCN